MDILCTDKTGTLTCDELHLEQHTGRLRRAPSPPFHAPLTRSMTRRRALRPTPQAPRPCCSTPSSTAHFQTGLRNVMDAAIVRAFGAEAEGESPRDGGGGPSDWCKVDEIPFDFQAATGRPKEYERRRAARIDRAAAE